MYCTNCGNVLSEKAKFCKACGQSITEQSNFSSQTDICYQTEDVNSQTKHCIRENPKQIGFSPKINDPAFAKYLKNTNRWAAIFSIVLALAAVIGFYIAGETSSEMDNPESLYIGLGIGGMFLVIAFFTVMGRKRSTTWDGAVVDKKAIKKREQQSYGDETRWETYIEYTVVIRADNGKKHKISVKDDDTRYNYFQMGDRVRHHAGLNSYEKYDKSRDTIVFCSACATLNDIQDDFCFRCKCPLLK